MPAMHLLVALVASNVAWLAALIVILVMKNPHPSPAKPTVMQRIGMTSAGNTVRLLCFVVGGKVVPCAAGSLPRYSGTGVHTGSGQLFMTGC